MAQNQPYIFNGNINTFYGKIQVSWTCQYLFECFWKGKYNQISTPGIPQIFLDSCPLSACQHTSSK